MCFKVLFMNYYFYLYEFFFSVELDSNNASLATALRIFFYTSLISVLFINAMGLLTEVKLIFKM